MRLRRVSAISLQEGYGEFAANPPGDEAAQKPQFLLFPWSGWSDAKQVMRKGKGMGLLAICSCLAT